MQLRWLHNPLESIAGLGLVGGMDSPVIQRLERKLGRFAIPHAIRILAGFQLLVWLLWMVNPEIGVLLQMDAGAILQGEVWRLVGFLFLPIGNGLLTLIAIMFLYFIGEGLEEAWGAFRVNLYLIVTIAAVFWANYLFGAPGVGLFVKSGLIMAFATVYPQYTIMLMLVIPMKMKWVGWIAAFTCLFYFWGGPAPLRMSVVAALFPFGLFVLPGLASKVAREAKSAERRREFVRSGQPEGGTFHRCHQCEITENEDSAMEFRVAEDGEEYCVKCLKEGIAARGERPDDELARS